MKQPLQITFRDMPHSDALETHIRERAAKLDEFFEHIMGCRVVIDDCFGDADNVAVRFRVSIPRDAGGEIVRNEIAILHFVEGKLAEWWGAYDRLSEQEQQEKM